MPFQAAALQRQAASPPPPATSRWKQRVAIAVILMLVTGAVGWGAMSLVHTAPAAKRQVARITILPDTPPPPPPPPDEKKPQPKEEQAAPQPMVVPKMETPPEPQQLKMEGEAGEGPSMFAAGEVKQDYIGGDIGNGTSKYAAYVARLEQRVQAELTRRKLHVKSVKLFVWLLPDGSVQRYSVQGGDQDENKTVRDALSEFTRVDEAPQPDMPMPVGLSIN